MKTLKAGDKGNTVVVLQKLLSKAGYNLPVTGIFNPLTLNIVKQFQQNAHLGVDGVVGKNTWRTLLRKHYNLKLGVRNKFLDNNEYISDYIPKDTIYLHHTAGGGDPRSVIRWWEIDNKPGKLYRVATAFVIGRTSIKGDDTFDGVSYRAFKEFYWANHLGLKTSHTNKSTTHNKSLEKKSIGIEICSYGHLEKEADGKFYFIIRDNNGKITVKREIPANQVYTLDQPWRGKLHFHKYTSKQISECKRLILLLAFIFDVPIPDRTYTRAWFDIKQDAILGKAGLWTHVNVRPDKTDCFPQPELIDMLNSLYQESLTYMPIDGALESLSAEPDLSHLPINDAKIQQYTADLFDSDI